MIYVLELDFLINFYEFFQVKSLLFIYLQKNFFIYYFNEQNEIILFFKVISLILERYLCIIKDKYFFVWLGVKDSLVW